MALLQELASAVEAAGGVDIDDFGFWVAACLRSRKFDVLESAQLLQKYSRWREEREIATLGGIYCETLRAQLATGFMQLTGGQDRWGRKIIHVFARLHADSSAGSRAFTKEETTRAVHFVLECALRGSAAAQARGVVYLIEMGDASEAVLTHCLSSLLPLLASSAMPVRVG